MTNDEFGSDASTEHRLAAVLRRSEDDAVSRVVAKGYGTTADQVIVRAKEHGLPIRQEPELVELLMQVDLDNVIPDTLYAAVSEILVWIHEMDTPPD